MIICRKTAEVHKCGNNMILCYEIKQELNNSSLKFNSFSSEKGYNYKIQNDSIFGKIKSFVDMILTLGAILPVHW